jgi:uncharacterized protein with NRDE domain
MCVLAFVTGHPRWRLVAIGNRDEFHARPSAPLAEWGEAPVVAGRDLLSGGTWMGVHRAGRFAVVTNVRGQPPRADARTRGELVSAALAGDPLPADLEAYNGFNLVSVERAARFATNRPMPRVSALVPGLYGVANAELDAPWPKTVRLKQMLADWLARGEDDPAGLFAGLAEEVPEDHALGSIFIRNPVYGTRCSTVVTVAADGAGRIVERRFGPAGETTGETAIAFRWPDLPRDGRP